MDVLSGSWPGEIYWFRGQGAGRFAAPQKLRHKDGTLINCGGGWQPGFDNMALFAGGVEYRKEGTETVPYYDGKKLEVPNGKSLASTGTASAVHATDWDSDGDLDLLVGIVRGEVWLVPNEGTRTNPSFGLEQLLTVNGEPLRVPGGDAGPFAADWDGDGLNDLLVGTGVGSVVLYRNTGRVGQPALAEPVTLVPAPPTEEPGSEPTRGTRSKICVTDWNEDGRLDLLVGDFAMVKPKRPEPTPEERAKQEALRDEAVKLQAQGQEILKRITELRLMSKDDPDRAQQQIKRLEQQLDELRPKLNEMVSQLQSEYEYHGWVWLFLRKPSE